MLLYLLVLGIFVCIWKSCCVSQRSLIGLVGPKHSGKTCVEHYLQHAYGCQYSFQFAERLKYLVQRLYHFRNDQLYTELKDVVDPRYNCTPRDKLHEIADRILEIDPYFFIRFAEQWLNWCHNLVGLKVIVDNRSPHEIEFTHSHGGIMIYLVRNLNNNDPKNHRAERQQEPQHKTRTHIVFNHGTKQQLFSKIDDILQSYGIQKNNNLT